MRPILWMLDLLLPLWTVSEIGVLLSTRTGRSGGAVRDRGSLRVLWLTIVGSICLGMWVGTAHPKTFSVHNSWALYLSLILWLVGLGIRWTAIFSLGRAFSANVAIRPGQRVRTDGLYRLVRHPSYLGLTLIFLAIGVSTRNWIGLLVATLPPMAALLYRIHVEERALLEAFGPEYQAYAARTRRLLPGIY